MPRKHQKKAPPKSTQPLSSHLTPNPSLSPSPKPKMTFLPRTLYLTPEMSSILPKILQSQRKRQLSFKRLYINQHHSLPNIPRSFLFQLLRMKKRFNLSTFMNFKGSLYG